MLIIPQSNQKNKVKTNQKQLILKGKSRANPSILHNRRVAGDNACTVHSVSHFPAPLGIDTLSHFAPMQNGSACRHFVHSADIVVTSQMHSVSLP